MAVPTDRLNGRFTAGMQPAAPAPEVPAIGVTQCYKWDRAAGMYAAYTLWRAGLILHMLVCGFCGRAAFGGTLTLGIVSDR